MLPVVRTFIALPAGIARMPMLRFQLYTFVGSWPWCFLLAYIGMKLGQAWDHEPACRPLPDCTWRSSPCCVLAFSVMRRGYGGRPSA